MRGQIVAAALLVSASALVVGVGGGWTSPPEGDEIQFSRTQMYIEYNATAGDVGMQVSMDGEPWKQLKVFRPDGRLIMEVKGRRSLALQGFTELFFESSEPALSQVPLSTFLARFPAGEYDFEGITLSGQDIEGTATFTHAIPEKPTVLTPVQDSIVNRGNAVVRWLPVPSPNGSPIVAYQVTATQVLDVLPKRVFSVHVPGSTFSVTIPQEFLQPDAVYEFEVLAIEEGGNQTIHRGDFTTAP